MIEMPIPSDIRKYEAKLIGPFTIRQTICGAAAAALSVSLYKLLDFLPDSGKYPIIFIVIVPFLLCGWIKLYGVPFEKFLKVAFISMFISPNKRKYKTENLFAYSSNENGDAVKNKKNNNPKKRKKKSKNSEFIAYK